MEILTHILSLTRWKTSRFRLHWSHNRWRNNS